MPIWKKLLVVLPAFLMLHLTATGAAPLLDGLRELWRPAGFDEVYFLAGFPAGYAMGAAVGITAAPGRTRPILALALAVSVAGSYWFAEIASGFAGSAAALALSGFAAGLALPVTARALGLTRNVIAGAIMAVLAAAGWWLSLPFVDYFEQGLPIGGTPGWAGPYYAQGLLCVVWLPLLLLLGGERVPGRRR
ncbi:MAG: hypothetical protein AB7O49_14735 [Sphingomonadales bacterium]